MTVRALLTISSVTMLLLGLVFLIFPEFFSLKLFPEANEKQIHIAIVHRQIMAGGCLFIGILLLLSRRNVTSAAKRILFGSSIGFFILLFIQIKLIFSGDSNFYWPVMIVFSVLAILSFYVSYFKKH